MRQKRIFLVILVITMLLGSVLSGCQKEDDQVSNSQDESINDLISDSAEISRTPEITAQATQSSLPSISEAPTPSPTPTPTPLPVGESGSISDLYFRLIGTHYNEGSGDSAILQPRDGYYFLYVDLEVRNDRFVQAALSALITFRIQDQNGRTWGVTIGDGKNLFLDVTLEPGESVQGTAAFELPNDVTENLTLIIKPDLLASSMLYFDLNDVMATQTIAGAEDIDINTDNTGAEELQTVSGEYNTVVDLETDEINPDQAVAAGIYPEPSEAASSIHVGDSIYSDTWIFKVIETRIDSEGKSFFTAPEGCVFYIIKMRVENQASFEQSMTSLLAFKLRDNKGNTYSVIVNPTIPQSLDGKLEPGSSLEGEITFVIPKDAEGLSLEIRPELVERKKISIELGE